ncbi:unnamed protein product [Brachionus calyciflorus]|uniref:Rho guanine nucleotide exchange factor 7 n=1 Tax=Brachionus calyciflorus TaxID=104777 RepID=A0A814IG12_9BILA|nr:unnamed protein product [Brachionus calyciflorus]
MVDVHNGTTRGIQGKKAKCVYNYKATMTDELNIKIDDIIVLTQCSEDETWLEGTLNGLTGWFPSNYVQILDEQQDVKRHENEDEILRNKYINELKQLEESFLDEMCKFIKIAIQPLKQNQIFSDLFVQNLICSLNDLIKFHQIFNQNLKEIIENSKIGNYLISVAPQFKKVYESYAKNNPKFTIEINNKKEELSKFFESTLAKMSSPLLPTTSTITVAIYFTKFLAAPFKQLEIYVKVLKEIQRYTQDFHVDRGDVQRSIEFYSELTNNVLEIRKMREYELDLMSSKINHIEEDLFKNGESIYLSQAVIINENGEIKDRILILFPNNLIILSPTNTPNEFDFEYKIQFKNQSNSIVAQLRKVTNIETVKSSYGSNISSSNFINKYCFELIDVTIHSRLGSIQNGKFLIICSSMYDLKNWIDSITNIISRIQFKLNNLKKKISCTSPISTQVSSNGSKTKIKKIFCMRPHAPLIPHFQLPNDAPIVNNNLDSSSTQKRFMYKKPKSSDIGKYHGADDDLKLLNVIDSLSKTKIRNASNVIQSVELNTSQQDKPSPMNNSLNTAKQSDQLNETMTNTLTQNERSLYKFINRLTEEKNCVETNLNSANNELNDLKKSNKELKTIVKSMQKQLENEKQTRKKLENFIKKHLKQSSQNQSEPNGFLANLDHESSI